MERHLDGVEWLVGEELSVADVSLFAYTQWADEGGFDLAARPSIRAWLTRCTNVFERADYEPKTG